LNQEIQKHDPDRRTAGLWSIVMVELTSHCNFSCSFCPSETMIRKKSMMPRELWRKVLLEIGEKRMTSTVFFHVLGEPLLHKDVFEAIGLANSYNLSVSLYTNGALLDENRSSMILRVLKKGRVVLSMQDISPESFSKRCRGTISWEDYINRLQTFVRIAETSKNPLNVQVHCMIDIKGLGWNLGQIMRQQRRLQVVYDQWRKALGMTKRRRINVFDPAASYPLGRHSSFFVKHAGNWDNQLIGKEMTIQPREKGHCSLMTDTFGVLSDGTCTYCCDDYEGRLNLGSALERSLEEIYYGEKARRIREFEKYGRLVEKRCMECRGTLFYKKTGKPVPSRNILSDFFFFKEHLNRYGLVSAFLKTKEAIEKRCRI